MLANTLQMGWNFWNGFNCNVNYTVIEAQANAIATSGLKDAGYHYVMLDDCWQDMNREGEDMTIRADRKRFPNGLKPVSDMIHNLGLKFGIYSSAGALTCQKRPGSLGHEKSDAKEYADWGVDYLKYDNCYNRGVAALDRYTAMKDAIAETGREMFYSICNWGNEGISMWGKTVAQSWRTTIDIHTGSNGAAQWQSMKSNFLTNMASADQAGKGGWNDPDMLLVGLGQLTAQEEATHFALWCFAKAPLIIGADLSKLDASSESMKLLMNKNLIAVNKDRLGNQAKCVQGCGEVPSILHIY